MIVRFVESHERVKLLIAAKLLVPALVAYIVLDVLLTPAGRLETRPVAEVTVIGFITLGLLSVGLVLALISLVLLYRRSRRARSSPSWPRRSTSRLRSLTRLGSFRVFDRHLQSPGLNWRKPSLPSWS